MSDLMSKCHDMWKEDMSRGRTTRGDDMQAPDVPGDYVTGGVVDHIAHPRKMVGGTCLPTLDDGDGAAVRIRVDTGVTAEARAELLRQRHEGRKDDTGKPRMDLIPPEALYALGRVLEYGARKYEDRNWEKGFAWGRSVAALKRHLAAWEAGQECDPESGMQHLWHVATNAVFLLTFAERGIGTDDRATGCALHLWADIRDSRTQEVADECHGRHEWRW